MCISVKMCVCFSVHIFFLVVLLLLLFFPLIEIPHSFQNIPVLFPLSELLSSYPDTWNGRDRRILRTYSEPFHEHHSFLFTMPEMHQHRETSFPHTLEDIAMSFLYLAFIFHSFSATYSKLGSLTFYSYINSYIMPSNMLIFNAVLCICSVLWAFSLQWVVQNWSQFSKRGLTRALCRGIITSVALQVILLHIPVWYLPLCATASHCELIFNLSSTITP